MFCSKICSICSDFIMNRFASTVLLAFVLLLAPLGARAETEEEKSYGKPLAPITWCQLAQTGGEANYLCARERAYQQGSRESVVPSR